MSCERYDRELALYVEGDLPELEAEAVTQHLETCARCRSFLNALEQSQRGIKELASEPLDEIALTSVRERVLASARKARLAPARAILAWGWTLAASLAVVVGMAVAWWARPAGRKEAAATHVTGPSRAVGAAPASSPSAGSATDRPDQDRVPEPTRRSTARAARAVSHDREQIGSTTLSPDEADQLARAVVAVSRIRSLSDLEPRGRKLSSGLAVLTTADPDVVIYWQLDSNGG